MVRLKVGDIVVYEHVESGNPVKNGLVGIVKSIKPDKEWGYYYLVDWLWTPCVAPSTYVDLCHPSNLRKLGEVSHG